MSVEIVAHQETEYENSIIGSWNDIFPKQNIEYLHWLITGISLMHEAAGQGDTTVVAFLINKGFDIHEIDDKGEKSIFFSFFYLIRYYIGRR